MKALVGMTGARTVLEIGMFTGYGTLAMAEALPGDGAVVTLELEPFLREFVKPSLEKSPHASKIDIRIGKLYIDIGQIQFYFEFLTSIVTIYIINHRSSRLIESLQGWHQKMLDFGFNQKGKANEILHVHTFFYQTILNIVLTGFFLSLRKLKCTANQNSLSPVRCSQR